MLEPTVVYENKNFLALNKPAGLLVHPPKFFKEKLRWVHPPAKPSKEKTLVDWLLKNYPEIKKVGEDPSRPGIVHRLDKETSGIILIPRNQKYFEYLKNLFKNREIKKTYLAWVFGGFKQKSGEIKKPIGIKSGTIKRSVFSKKMSKPAETRFRVLETKTINGVPVSLLKVEPLTGRTHQIRVHLSSIGHPVLGDKIYSHISRGVGVRGLKSEPIRLMLHAYSLEFNSAEGERIKIEADPPKDFFPPNFLFQANISQ